MATAPKPKAKKANVVVQQMERYVNGKPAIAMTAREKESRTLAKSRLADAKRYGPTIEKLELQRSAKAKPKTPSKTVDQKRKPDGTYPKGTKVPGYAAQKGKTPKGPVTNKFSKARPAKPDTRIAGRGR